jgi:hypothetical protein
LASFEAGSIGPIDWSGDALARDPNKLCLAVVVEDESLFGPDYPNVILMPLSEDARLAIPGLAEPIDPMPENCCAKRCYALAPFMACTSAARVRGTTSRVAG